MTTRVIDVNHPVHHLPLQTSPMRLARTATPELTATGLPVYRVRIRWPHRPLAGAIYGNVQLQFEPAPGLLDVLVARLGRVTGLAGVCLQASQVTFYLEPLPLHQSTAEVAAEVVQAVISSVRSICGQDCLVRVA